MIEKKDYSDNFGILHYRESVKFRNGKLKGLLKSTLQGVLPDEIMHLPKSGFAGPIRYWIEKHLIKSMFEQLVEDPLPFYREYLNISIIKETLIHRERYWIEKHLIKSMFEQLVHNPLPFYCEYLNVGVIKETLLHKERYRKFLPTLFSLYIFNLWYRKHVMREGIIIQ